MHVQDSNLFEIPDKITLHAKIDIRSNDSSVKRRVILQSQEMRQKVFFNIRSLTILVSESRIKILLKQN